MAGDRLNSIGDELRALLPVSADAYLQKIDLVRGLGLVIRLDAGIYRSASFLDDRILGPSTQGSWLSGIHMTEAARQIASPRPVHFIFHTGHVGSTLLSRLLDETGVVLSLREPLPLRSIADAHDLLGLPESLLSEAQFSALLDMTLCLWSRGYDWTRAVAVKATSSAGRVATPLLNARPRSLAIYLNLPAEPYLATLLSGQNSPEDLRGHGPGRIRRLQARCRAPLAPLHAMSLGELAALGWLAETMSQQDARRRFPDRVLAVDFEELLSSLRDGMARILGFLGLPTDARYLAGLEANPVLKRYSKAPELPFTPAARKALLDDTRRDQCGEIDKGLAWLERLARADDTVASVMATTATP